MAGIYGVDVSQGATSAQWHEAMQRNNATFGIVRCYEEGNQRVGYVDPQAVASIRSARQAGLGTVGVYHFPTLRKTATEQTQESFTNLVEGGVTIGRYWLDIEISGNNWSDARTNVAFIKEWVSAANSLIGEHPELGCTGIGIYTRKSQWSTVTAGLLDLSQYPLWFVYESSTNRDGPHSFGQFEEFGGWTEPLLEHSMVQWDLDVQGTNGFGWDASWRPADRGTGSTSAATGGSTSSGSSEIPPPRAPYVVQPGDTLSGIASRFGTTVEALRDLNHLDSDNIAAGRTLNLSPQV